MSEKKIKKNKDFWLKLWKLIEPSHKLAKVMFGLVVVLQLFNLIEPYFLKLIIDKLTKFDAAEFKGIIYLIIILFFLQVINSFVHFFRDRLMFRMYFDIESYLQVLAQKKLVYLSLSYHERENTGNKITKIANGIQKILDLLGNLGWEVIPTFLQLAGTLTVLFIVDWRFGLSMLVFAPIFIWITFFSNKIIYPLRKKRFRNYEEATGMMTQSIYNVNTVKSFVQEKRETKTYATFREYIRDKGKKEWYSLIKYWIARDQIIDLGRATVLLLGVYFVWTGEATVGTLVFVFTLSERAYFALFRLSRFYDRVEEGAIAVDRFMTLLNEKQDIVNKKDGLKPKNIIGSYRFKDLTFSYNGDKQKALYNVNVRIEAGCVTALVGPSGGGKTTLARMMYRHYDPQSGQVLLDDKDLREYDLYTFRKHLAIVPQEVEIFNDSVSNNIAYARPQASFKEIQAAARIANAEEFIDKLEKKYDTEVGERGIKLSGGQRQRVGIARAILANPRVLIFDEATSSLDSYSERLIQNAMDKITRDRTVVIIAHRLSTIKKADKIIVLEEGRVVEQGSHFELAHTKGGLYAKLLKLQMMGEVD